MSWRSWLSFPNEPLILDQHLLRQLRMAKDMQLAASQACDELIAASPLRLFEKAEHVALERRQMAEQGNALQRGPVGVAQSGRNAAGSGLGHRVYLLKRYVFLLF